MFPIIGTVHWFVGRHALEGNLKNHFKNKPKTDTRFTLAIGSNSLHTTNIGQSIIQVCTPSVDVNTLSFAGKRGYHSNGTNLQVDTTVTNSNTSAITSIDVNTTN